MPDTFFDEVLDYDDELQKGLRYTGENKSFFIDGRLKNMIARLPQTFAPKRILDFGCGVGDTAAKLALLYPQSEVVGADTSLNTLSESRKKFSTPNLSFISDQELEAAGSFDLCYVNGVFHHIPEPDQLSTLKRIHNFLNPNSYLAVYENTPWNPGSWLVMRLCPFDKHAKAITPGALIHRLLQAGFQSADTPGFLFYFPRIFSWLRFLEPHLNHLPLGAQYGLLAVKQPK